MKKLTGSKHTGKWVIENYPPNGRTFSYMHELIEDDFMEKKRNKTVFSGSTRFGEAVYIEDMTNDQRSLFCVAAIAMNALKRSFNEVQNHRK